MKVLGKIGVGFTVVLTLAFVFFGIRGIYDPTAASMRFGLPAVLPAPIKKAIKAADRVSAWLEAVRIAGFGEAEADKLFGRPGAEILTGLEIRLRPPAVVRADYVARVGQQLAAII